MKLLIRNLNRNTTEEDIMAMFKSYVTVESVSLVMDKTSGKSKGFGFVEIPDEDEADEAIKRLNGKMVRGNKIRVKQAE